CVEALRGFKHRRSDRARKGANGTALTFVLIQILMVAVVMAFPTIVLKNAPSLETGREIRIELPELGPVAPELR
ncbi:MAG: hypothetical protein DI537_20970, partial [Stutzerimonas stutzeri]